MSEFAKGFAGSVIILVRVAIRNLSAEAVNLHYELQTDALPFDQRTTLFGLSFSGRRTGGPALGIICDLIERWIYNNDWLARFGIKINRILESLVTRIDWMCHYAPPVLDVSGTIRASGQRITASGSATLPVTRDNLTPRIGSLASRSMNVIRYNRPRCR